MNRFVHLISILIVSIACVVSLEKSYGQTPIPCNFGGWANPSAQDNYITNVTIGGGGGINNTTAGTTGAYQNYTGNVDGTVAQGGSYASSVSYNGSSWGWYISVYVDWNDDGDFADANETIVNNAAKAAGSGAGTHNFTLSVPGTAPLGTVTMRVYNSNASVGSCANSFGEAEDYELVVSSSSATPPALNAAVGASVDNAFDVTYTDDATWRAAITSITIGGTTLSGGWSKSVGKITFTPSASNPVGLLQTAGAGKSIVVKATGYSDATVSQTILAGTPTKLGINTQPPTSTTSGVVLSPQPVVLIQDQYGNTTTSTANVVATVDAGSWTLGGTTTKAGVSGISTFTNLTASNATVVTGATIIFTSAGLISVTSNTFNIVFYSCSVCDVIVSGSTDYTTAAINKEYCLTSGTWTGNITVNHAGTKVCIAGTWNPSTGISIAQNSSLVDNVGTINAPSITLAGSAAFTSSGTTTLTAPAKGINMSGSSNFTTSGTLTVNAVEESLYLDGTGTFSNSGTATLTTSGASYVAVNIPNTSTADFTNTGTFSATCSNASATSFSAFYCLGGTAGNHTTITNNGTFNLTHPSRSIDITNYTDFTSGPASSSTFYGYLALAGFETFTNNGNIEVYRGTSNNANSGQLALNSGTFTNNKKIVFKADDASTLSAGNLINSGYLELYGLVESGIPIYNECLIKIRQNYTNSGGAVTGPAEGSGNYGKFIVGGSATNSGYFGINVAQTANYELDMQAGLWTNVGFVGTRVTFNTRGISTACSITLPVELLYFNATCITERNIELQWATATETNNDKFIIEHSFDGINFELLYYVDGAGNSNKRIDYTTNDYSAIYGVNYYRLTQVDYDGKVEMYPVISVTCEPELSRVKLMILTNPIVNNEVTFSISGIETQTVQISIIDNLGRSIYQGNKAVDNNLLTTIPLYGTIAKGMYVMRVNSAYLNLSEKLLVK